VVESQIETYVVFYFKYRIYKKIIQVEKVESEVERIENNTRGCREYWSQQNKRLQSDSTPQNKDLKAKRNNMRG